MLLSARADVADDTKDIRNDEAVDDDAVIVHRYHPSRQGTMVEDTLADLLPNSPVKRLKFANIVESPNAPNWAKLCVPRLRYALLVLVIVERGIAREMFLLPDVPSPLKRNTPPLAKMGKSVDNVTLTLDLVM